MPYISVSALSHVGLVRENNEDSLVVGPWTLCSSVTENPQTLLFALGTPLVVAVADGLGGQPGGEVASSLVVRRLARVGGSLHSTSAVREGLESCNRAVYEAADEYPGLGRMGTTVAGVVVLPDAMLAFNVGDSRVFDVDGNGLHQVSVDDNPPLAPGQRTTPIVTQALGGTAKFRPVHPHVAERPLSVGTRCLVCSDGLTDPVSDDALSELLREHDGGRAAFELWKAAMEAGGPDNITIAVVRIGA
ncbi:protein phosphatase 2C domain-containing protein [Streptomyces sp. RB6PN25]|uniref:Protein phosphatase 2C domain-containing protein n=1 Tax=Streptomyces humicola TaxID=2953240 RepID=A0ABT1PZJ5_9ACTN|nr:protein phosphatase 2C domain-containing protein [Streptomyces humicola]MCQ4082553.1 protein phosphatase 2C domain-containing protein [Streptomyces humicola]